MKSIYPSNLEDSLGIADELAWDVLLGPAGLLDMMMAAYIGCMTSGSIWSPGKGGNAVENAYDHWKKHKGEFPELNNAKEYVEAAKEFLNNPPPTALTKVRPNGDVVVYDPVSNLFAVMSNSGEPKTMLKPDPAVHGYPSNVDYFNAQ